MIASSPACMWRVQEGCKQRQQQRFCGVSDREQGSASGETDRAVRRGRTAPPRASIHALYSMPVALANGPAAALEQGRLAKIAAATHKQADSADKHATRARGQRLHTRMKRIRAQAMARVKVRNARPSATAPRNRLAVSLRTQHACGCDCCALHQRFFVPRSLRRCPPPRHVDGFCGEWARRLSWRSGGLFRCSTRGGCRHAASGVASSARPQAW